MSDISTKITNLINTLNSIQEDAQKTQSGNKSAGTRVRKSMQDVINTCKEVRKEVLEIRNSDG